jgi:hypothetical protein
MTYSRLGLEDVRDTSIDHDMQLFVQSDHRLLPGIPVNLDHVQLTTFADLQLSQRSQNRLT